MEKELADLKDKNKRLIMISRLLLLALQMIFAFKITSDTKASKYVREIVREADEVIKECEC